MTTITNKVFLQALFGADWRRAWVTGFEQDPGRIAPDRRGLAWGGGEYRNGGFRKIQNPEIKNTFFTISTFHRGADDKVRRRKALFDACHVIMVDDVGTKVSELDLELLGAESATYKLETSPGNWQWGYKLAGDAPRWRVEKLQAEMVKRGLAIDGRDPGMKGVTRYGRLPEGVNNKAKYVEQLGRPFAHQLTDWHPERTFTLDELARIFQIDLPTESPQGANPVAAAAGGQMDSTDDPVLGALHEEGLVLREKRDGLFDILCPWAIEHTDGDTSGSAYYRRGFVGEDGTHYPDGGFKCHHGHCEDRTVHDLTEYLRDNGYPEIGSEQFEVVDDTRDDDTEDAPVRPLPVIHAPVWAGKTPPPREWVIEDWIPAGKPTALYGGGGVGKTLIMQDLQTCIAKSIPFFGHAIGKPGKTLGVYCEDDEDELHRRQRAINAKYVLADQDADGVYLINRAGEDNLLMVFDKFGVGKLTRFWREVEATVLHLGVSVLFLDNIAETFGGNEIVRTQVRQFLNQAVGRLCARHKISVVLLGHPSQAGESTGTGYSGSTDWNNGVRARLYLQRDKDHPEIRILSRLKANYASSGDEAGEVRMVWRHGSFLDMATGGDFLEDQEAEANRVFLALLEEVIGRNEYVNTSHRERYAPKVFVSMCRARGLNGFSVKRFEEAMEYLLTERRIHLERAHRNTNSMGLFITGKREKEGAANAANNL